MKFSLDIKVKNVKVFKVYLFCYQGNSPQARAVAAQLSDKLRQLKDRMQDVLVDQVRQLCFIYGAVNSFEQGFQKPSEWFHELVTLSMMYVKISTEMYVEALCNRYYL